MKILDTIDADLKTALLAGDKDSATTLRGLKSAVLYESVAQNKRDEGLSEDEVIRVLSKEQKKRQESIDLYKQAGDEARAQAEQREVEIIAKYLPEQMSEAELTALVDEVLSVFDSPSPKDMGQVIGQVKAKAGPSADGALIASIVKAKLGVS